MSNETSIFGEEWPFSKAKTILLKAAADVMRDAGPRSATLKNIAGKAGVTEPAIFRHFDGVDGMFQSLFSVVELYLNYFMDLYKYDLFMGIDRLESVFTKTLQALKDDKELSYMISQPDAIFRQYPKLKTRLKDLHQKERALALDCLKEAKAKGQLLGTTDVDTATSLFTGVSTLVLQGWIDGEYADPVKEGKKLWTAFKALIAKPGLQPLMRPQSAIVQKVKLTPVVAAKSVPKTKGDKKVTTTPKKAAAAKPAAKKAAPKAKPAVKKAAPKAKAAVKKVAPKAKPAVKKVAPKAKVAEKKVTPKAKPAVKKAAPKAAVKKAAPKAKPAAKPVVKQAVKPIVKPAPKPLLKIDPTK